ncbi:MAG: carboxypeptidase regulatory-like domain-containing protein [Candidatus Zixiibacteriota bacterium]|nr:MAG: carboxypeptidase regulatory-like domain-containing protein [candidate division Zixibacteria bacterium]
MARKIILTFLLVCLSGSMIVAKPVEHYFKFQISDRQELLELTGVVSISRVDGKVVFAYANESQMRAFEDLGYDYTLLPHPSSLIVPKMAATLEELGDWDVYPSYDQYVAMMYQFQTDFPNLCQIHVAGSTPLGHELIFARISDNVATDEEEPEVMYTSSMHGNELTGYVLMLRLVDSLLTAYGSDPEITDLVNNLDIWINPLANPDGAYITGDESVEGAIRYNSNAVDLNRNFPDPAWGDHPDGNPWQQETIVMMDFAASHNFVLSANFHGGAEVVNYPWDCWSRLHPDNDWYYFLSRDYADTVHEYAPPTYMNGFDDGVTNGYAWYPVHGGRQDYMNYWHGGRETTIEISLTKLPPGSSLPSFWEYNRASMLQYIEKALFGIRGVVRDSHTNRPLEATVTVVGHDIDNSEISTDSITGNYHRMLAPGTYDLEFTSDGYDPLTVYGVSVTDYQVVVVDAPLEQLPGPYVCGDVDGENEMVDILDIDFFIAYMYLNGPAPLIWRAADVDGSGSVDVMDIDYLIDYLFRGGPDLICGA